jgi:hypothetical protein
MATAFANFRLNRLTLPDTASRVLHGFLFDPSWVFVYFAFKTADLRSAPTLRPISKGK